MEHLIEEYHNIKKQIDQVTKFCDDNLKAGLRNIGEDLKRIDPRIQKNSTFDGTMFSMGTNQTFLNIDKTRCGLSVSYTPYRVNGDSALEIGLKMSELKILSRLERLNQEYYQGMDTLYTKKGLTPTALEKKKLEVMSASYNWWTSEFTKGNIVSLGTDYMYQVKGLYINYDSLKFVKTSKGDSLRGYFELYRNGELVFKYKTPRAIESFDQVWQDLRNALYHSLK